MVQTVLVLGATGKTGRRLVDQLKARDVTVRAASRQRRDEYVRFDWDDEATFLPVLKGADAVYLIGPDFVEDPSSAIRSFLDTARTAGVARVVSVSSLGITFPGEPADSGRRKIEHLVMDSGLDWVILRLSGFNQNFSEGFMLPGILQTGAVSTATGNGAASFVDADDIAAVAAAALTEEEHSRSVYSVTGPEALTFTQAAAIIGRAAGREIAHNPITSNKLTDILVANGVPPEYGAMLVRDQQGIREGAGAQVTDTVANMTGRPATTFADYATRNADVWSQPLNVATL